MDRMTAPNAASARFARRCIAAGAAADVAGLVLGAFGTHLRGGSRARRANSPATRPAVLYQLLHALGLVLVGHPRAGRGVTAQLRWSARLMGFGIACFSGSIYLATAGAPHGCSTVAPVGGLAFMASWVLLALHAIARERD